MPENHPNSIEDFDARFRDLSMEAHSYGISTIYAVNDSDQLTKQDRSFFGYSGGKYTAIGLATILLQSMTNDPPALEGED
jgi:hypothetical protein